MLEGVIHSKGLSQCKGSILLMEEADKGPVSKFIMYSETVKIPVQAD